MYVIGARPNFMKVAPLMRAVEATGRLGQILVHTGQHYDANMSDSFFRDLSLPAPDVHLAVGGGSHAEQTGRIMIALEKVCLERRPGCVVVLGDVNSTLAGALVAAKLQIPLAHVEAGLRSFDRRMPEEVNRVVTDALADILFTTSEPARANLLREGVAPERIFVVGNIMVDSVLANRDRAAGREIIGRLGLLGRPYGLVTLHRAANVDDAATFSRLTGALAEVAKTLPLVFPVHPRARKQMRLFGLEGRFVFHDESSDEFGPPREGAINCYPPLGYLDFLALTMHAALVLTDSGGLQVEAAALGVPCVTMRDRTEWVETVSHGTNVLVGSDPEAILAAARAALGPERRPMAGFEGWDGQAARRMAAVLAGC
jgi:UDP-N-acetylglucosamine 2-epimerase (non-hydrolysing)